MSLRVRRDQIRFARAQAPKSRGSRNPGLRDRPPRTGVRGIGAGRLPGSRAEGPVKPITIRFGCLPCLRAQGPSDGIRPWSGPIRPPPARKPPRTGGIQDAAVHSSPARAEASVDAEGKPSVKPSRAWVRPSGARALHPGGEGESVSRPRDRPPLAPRHRGDNDSQGTRPLPAHDSPRGARTLRKPPANATLRPRDRSLGTASPRGPSLTRVRQASRVANATPAPAPPEAPAPGG